jgi:type I restriction enzyme R subunit
MTEADTCRQTVVPRLQTAGWEVDPHRISEQVTFTDGRIIPFANRVRRGKQKRADYLLRYTRDFPIAVVEAKAECHSPGVGRTAHF